MTKVDTTICIINIKNTYASMETNKAVALITFDHCKKRIACARDNTVPINPSEGSARGGGHSK